MDQDEKKQKESRETSSVGGSDANITRQLESIQEDIQQIKADISKLVMTKNSVNEGSKKGDESDVNIAGLAIGYCTTSGGLVIRKKGEDNGEGSLKSQLYTMDHSEKEILESKEILKMSEERDANII
ncbi:uncharacterized protein RJT20DRAFT_1244 [Scheffersomyces xylosifermentans]|uniref:uncharacterized protein n=1 Tax=Scheffersomyces xylosifermentans TaxID=1304137 RepID=UPI00315D6CE8